MKRFWKSASGLKHEIRKLVIARSSAMEVAKMAVGQGMKTLRQVALDKAREGLSTLEQVLLRYAA